MIDISYWVIRKKCTDLFLPAPRGRGGRGGTWVELCHLDIDPPRLFSEERHAKIALHWWLKGKLSVNITGDIAWGDCDEDWHTKAVPSRKVEDMEVVQCKLEIIS